MIIRESSNRQREMNNKIASERDRRGRVVEEVREKNIISGEMEIDLLNPLGSFKSNLSRLNGE
jgi:hypothetical protein